MPSGAGSSPKGASSWTASSPVLRCSRSSRRHWAERTAHSLREALRAGGESVDTGHLALGLLTLGEGPAHDVMVNLGVGYDALREAVAAQTET
ncbi:MAG TPA: Clp protease N-terminal domain-containing protein [Actinoallomurus sp.]|nr:Clp protease N-terminal domain-containing protein [Actinoallomurus sp.]